MAINRDSIWRGRFASDVIVRVLSVSDGSDSVTAKVRHNTLDDTKMSYVLDTFEHYYELTDMTKSRVIFKKDSTNDVVAFLLDVPSNYGSVVCYSHVGQHSEASLGYARDCKPATPEEYHALAMELQNSVGYYLTVRNKFPSGFVQGE
jgi:hypothetical protein